jgi:hypothetical protein
MKDKQSTKINSNALIQQPYKLGQNEDERIIRVKKAKKDLSFFEYIMCGCCVMRDDKNIIEDKIRVSIAPADHTRIEDNYSLFSQSFNHKCCIDVQSEVLLVKISLGKLLPMIKTIEFEVAHFIKIVNPCYRSKV